VSLKNARQRRDELRRQLASGVAPSAKRTASGLRRNMMQSWADYLCALVATSFR